MKFFLKGLKWCYEKQGNNPNLTNLGLSSSIYESWKIVMKFSFYSK